MKLQNIIDKVKVYLNEYVPELSTDIIGNDSSDSNIKSILFESVGSLIMLLPKKKRPYADGKMAYVDGQSSVNLTVNTSLATYNTISWFGKDVNVGLLGTNVIQITGKTSGKNYVHSIVLAKSADIGADRIVLSKVYDLTDSAQGLKFTVSFGNLLSGYKTESSDKTVVYCPPNYVSLNYIKASQWAFPVFKTYDIDSPEYYFETSPYTKRKTDAKMFEELGETPRLIHMESGTTFTEFSYNPKLEPEDLPVHILDLMCVYTAIIYSSIKAIETTALNELFKTKLNELSAS